MSPAKYHKYLTTLTVLINFSLRGKLVLCDFSLSPEQERLNCEQASPSRPKVSSVLVQFHLVILLWSALLCGQCVRVNVPCKAMHFSLTNPFGLASKSESTPNLQRLLPVASAGKLAASFWLLSQIQFIWFRVRCYVGSVKFLVLQLFCHKCDRQQGFNYVLLSWGLKTLNVKTKQNLYSSVLNSPALHFLVQCCIIGSEN